HRNLSQQHGSDYRGRGASGGGRRQQWRRAERFSGYWQLERKQVMDLLKRELSPVTTEAWQQIDEEARRVLKLHLAGRKLVDFAGPHGWGLGAVNTGRLTQIEGSPVDQVGHAVRDVKPLVELRTPIALPILELDYAARGAQDLDLDPVIAAAERVARAEDTA